MVQQLFPALTGEKVRVQNFMDEGPQDSSSPPYLFSCKVLDLKGIGPDLICKILKTNSLHQDIDFR